MRIAVLSAGNAGQALAGGMTLAGHHVHLASIAEHAAQIAVVQTFGGVLVEGSTALGLDGGFARIARADTDVAAAVANADITFLVSPAYGQDAYFDYIVGHAPTDQLVVIQPGKFGSLRLAQMMREAGRDPGELLIAETGTFIYAAKIHGLDHIWLRGLKKQVGLAALPSRRTAEAVARLSEIHPQYVAASSVLETSMGDPSYALHPVSTLLDLSRIEQMGPYRTRSYSVTPAVGRMVEAVDAERCAVAEALGVPVEPILVQAAKAYGLTGESFFEAIDKSTVHVDQMTPRSATHRYVSEEVPYGLVPLSEIAGALGVATPNIDAIIALASTVNQVDYRAEGRQLEAIGLASLGPAEIADLLDLQPVDEDGADIVERDR